MTPGTLIIKDPLVLDVLPSQVIFTSAVLKLLNNEH